MLAIDVVENIQLRQNHEKNRPQPIYNGHRIPQFVFDPSADYELSSKDFVYELTDHSAQRRYNLIANFLCKAQTSNSRAKDYKQQADTYRKKADDYQRQAKRYIVTK